MCAALDVAKYIVSYQQEKKTKPKFIINNQRLQKLLYFIQAFSYNKRGKPLFQDEMEAWPLGPVVPDVYFYYPTYGELAEPAGAKSGCSKKEIKFVQSIVDKLEDYPTEQLTTICQSQEPWKSSYTVGEANIISKSILRSYFPKEKTSDINE